jgi:hypothetical protein
MLLGLAGQAAAVAVASRVVTAPAEAAPLDAADGALEAKAASASSKRLKECYRVRVDAAIFDRDAGEARHPTNGDEARYTTRIGNFSKGLPHNSVGEVDSAAYQSLLDAVSSGDPAQFEQITMGGTAPLINPQSGLAFDMEGLDSHQLAMGPPPAVASAQRAGEAVEVYWMALLRDVNFSDYASNSLAQAASAELSKLSDFRGPKINGQVTPQTLFRGYTAGDVTGPHISQFLLKPLEYGAIHIEQRMNTYLPLTQGGTDYMTDAASFLAVQSGQGPFGSNRVDPTTRQIRNGRDLAAYVHIDVLFEAYFNACLWLIDNGAPLNPSNPYAKSKTQTGFGTFGAPHIKALVAETATRALKAVWYQKWFVHRALRPEAYGGLVHFTKTKAASYPLHSDILNSEALTRVQSRNGTFFLPHAFPEGCPQHPTYGAGHATVAGACATIVKAFFDDTAVLSNMTDIVQASADGLSLVPYTGADKGQITVGGEMNKLAANIAIGRNHAAVHWRSDYADSLKLGEQVAISILRDQKPTYNESFDGFTFTRFDGTRFTV